MMFARALWLHGLGIAMIGMGCASDPPRDVANADAGTMPDAATQGDASTAPDASGCVPGTTYAQLRDSIFAPHCATGRCHGGTTGPGLPQGPSDFTASSTREAMVGRPSAWMNGMDLVRPGDPAASFLIAKLTNQLPADPRQDGVAMPPAGRGTWMPLPAADVARIRCWIASGAP